MKLKKGYISQGKVKLSLACCADGSSCFKCPFYTFANCRPILAQEALTFITRLEIKVDDYEKKESKS